MKDKHNREYNFKRLLLSKGTNMEDTDETLKILSESKISLEKDIGGIPKIGACCL